MINHLKKKINKDQKFTYSFAFPHFPPHPFLSPKWFFKYPAKTQNGTKKHDEIN